MADDTENHTLKLLQEMRKEMREQFVEMHGEFADMREGFAQVNARIDGVTHIMTLMAGQSYALDARVDALEKAVDLPQDG